MLKFTKMNGAGNDFVLVDNRAGSLHLSREAIARLCDRHRGIGADGLIAVEAPETSADFRMRYYNADGGEAEMCGNGARCFARFARPFTEGDAISFETLAGVITARFRGEEVELAMSEPLDLRLDQSIEADGHTFTVHSVNTGVPHAVIFTDKLEGVPILDWGAALRYHPTFAPKGTNANFVQQLSGSDLAIRTYERGVEGETLACGTGVVAAAIVAHAARGLSSPVRLLVKGGEYLTVAFESEGDAYRQVTLTGPAEAVFDGEVVLPLPS